MYKILIVDTNKKNRDKYATLLESNGYEVEAVENALAAIEKCSFNVYNLIITEFHMEGIDGIQFITYIKKITPGIKTILLADKLSMDDEYAALDVLADRYILKNTREDVILKHLEVLFNNEQAHTQHGKLLIDKETGIKLDVVSHSITKYDEEMSVTPKEFGIIKVLLENKGKVVKRSDIVETIWETDFENVDIRVVDVHMKSIRRKLQVPNIVSIRGVGYKWE